MSFTIITHAAFSRDDLDKIEAEMKKIIKEGKALERFTLGRDEAIKFMEERNEPYKVELIRDLPEDAEISFYSQGEFVDLCAGPHLMSTKNIKAYKLISSSGAYWLLGQWHQCAHGYPLLRGIQPGEAGQYARVYWHLS